MLPSDRPESKTTLNHFLPISIKLELTPVKYQVKYQVRVFTRVLVDRLKLTAQLNGVLFDTFQYGLDQYGRFDVFDIHLRIRWNGHFRQIC